MKNVAHSLLLLVLGAALGSAAVTLAANKQITSTLVPPAGITAGGYQICITNNAKLGDVADTLIATTRACAYDITTQQRECKDVVESTKTPPAEMIGFINARLAKWRTDNGY